MVIGSIAVAFVAGALTLPQLFVTTFIAGTLGVAFDISWSTQFITVVERDEYLTANSMFNGSRSMAQVAGPLVGGVLIQVFSAPIAVLVDAVSYLFSAFFLTRVKAPEPPIEPVTESIRTRLSSGLSFIVRDGVMRTGVDFGRHGQLLQLRVPGAVRALRDDLSGLEPRTAGAGSWAPAQLARWLGRSWPHVLAGGLASVPRTPWA